MRSTTLLRGTLHRGALAAALLLGSVLTPALAPALAQPAPNPSSMTKPHHGGGKLRGVFTPQQRVMYMHKVRHEFREQTRDQRRAFRKEQATKIAAMSDAQRTTLKAEMQARWDALPQARKDRIEQHIAMRETNRHDRMAPSAR